MSACGELTALGTSGTILAAPCNRPAGHPGEHSAASTAARRWRRPESARARELRIDLTAGMNRARLAEGMNITDTPAAAVLELLAAAYQRDPQEIAELLTARGWER